MCKMMLTLTNLDVMQKRYEKFGQEFNSVRMPKYLERVAKDARNIAKVEAPQGETGELRKGIELKRPSSLSFELWSNAPYSEAVRKGQKGHNIYGGYHTVGTRSKEPKRFLFWRGAPHYYYRVWHDPKPANPFDERTKARVDELLSTLIPEWVAQIKVELG